MTSARIVAALTLAITTAGCGGANQALLASGGHKDFAEMNRVSGEYGTGDADAIVPVMVGDQEYTYRIWISKDGRRIMAQTGSMAGAAAAGFARGLTAGIAKGDQDFEPYQQAAIDYLDRTRGPGCALSNSRKLTHIGWEWDFNCTPPQASPRPRKRA